MNEISNFNIDTGKSHPRIRDPIVLIAEPYSRKSPVSYPFIAVLLCFPAIIPVWEHLECLAPGRLGLWDLDNPNLSHW